MGVVTAYIALGSNLGDRATNLIRAVELLRSVPGITLGAVSMHYETEPVGGPPGQNKYLNAAAALETTLSPYDLLRALLDIENQLGRVRGERFSPRTIDLDLLLYGNQTCQTPELTLPHPRMHERAFVMEPLAEIAEHVRHPQFHFPMRELLGAVRGSGDKAAGRELA